MKYLTEVQYAELDEMLKTAKTHKMSRQEREDQLVSLVWGNNLEGDSTFESVRAHLNLD